MTIKTKNGDFVCINLDITDLRCYPERVVYQGGSIVTTHEEIDAELDKWLATARTYFHTLL